MRRAYHLFRGVLLCVCVCVSASVPDYVPYRNLNNDAARPDLCCCATNKKGGDVSSFLL
jgi:hypothetical protein